jgi:hypothetical protein
VGARSGDTISLGDRVLVTIEDVAILRRQTYGRRIPPEALLKQMKEAPPQLGKRGQRLSSSHTGPDAKRSYAGRGRDFSQSRGGGGGGGGGSASGRGGGGRGGGGASDQARKGGGGSGKSRTERGPARPDNDRVVDLNRDLANQRGPRRARSGPARSDAAGRGKSGKRRK